MKKDYLTANNLSKSKGLKQFFFTFLFLLLFFNISQILAQTIPATDGGSRCAQCVPPGWINVEGTPDISDRTYAAASGTNGGGTPWDAWPLPLPPNGHTDWISLRDLGPAGIEEVVSTNMAGLIPGRAYEVTVYTLTATGPYSPIFNDSFTYQVGTNPIITISPITQNVWGTSTFQFVASAATETLFLRPGNNSGGAGLNESVQVSVTLNAIVAVPIEIDVEGNGIPIIGNGTNTPNTADNTDFGQVTSGTNSLEQIFTIHNRGANPLIVGPSFSTNPNFVITTTPSTPVAPGGSTTIGVTFNAPVALGIDSATIFIANNDPDEGAYQINLEAESIAPTPEMDVLGNSISIVGDGSNVSNLLDGTDFGPIIQGTASIERIFTIQNTGLAPLNLNPSFTSNPAFVITTPATTPVPPGGSVLIGITFNAPATVGVTNATLFIANSDADENPYQINLSGTSAVDTDGDSIADLTDVDDDNDGILDVTEGLVDTDGDGVINSLDLDSDNDGIADLIETGGIDIDNDGRIDGFTDLDGNGLDDSLDNPELFVQDNAASTLLEFNSIGSLAPKDCIISVESTSPSYGNYSIRVDNSTGNHIGGPFANLGLDDTTTYQINFRVSLISAVADGQVRLYSSIGVNGNGQTLVYTGNAIAVGETLDVTATFMPASGAENIQFSVFVDDAVYLIDKVSIRESLVQVLPNNDTDINLDFLDLDSDNDGIPDNIEAQLTLGYVAPDGTFDSNGVDTGYIIGLNPIDTDFDLIPDYLDLDSDNEGANDTIEAGLILSGTFGNNGLDSNSEISDDFSDVNGSFDDPQADFPDSDGDINFGGDVDFRDSFFAPDKDGDGVPDIGDLDDDNDGIPDVVETGGQDPSVDGDGDNVPFYLDDDDSNPAIGDDDGLIQPGFDLDGDLIANHLDLDADNDGIFDLHEAGHTELDIDFNGEIDGVPADFGANGLFNTVESDDTPAATITYTLLDSDGDTTIDALDVDDDNDGVNTVFEVDNADLDGDPTTGVVIDTDLDTILDYLDIDDDGDRVNTILEVDNADIDGDPTTGVVIDTDSDTTLDYLDIDDDGDGVNTVFEVDNTDLDGDPTTGVVIDTDLDTILDYLDDDDDGDSINTEFEVDNSDADGDPTTGGAIDSDGDTILNYLDADDDGDGIVTINENPDPNADGNPLDAEDKDGDGIPNYLDLDSDNDGILDSVELAIDTDGDGVQNYVDLDSDNDGIFDVVEAGLEAFDSNFDGVIDTLISVGTNGLFDALETFPDSGILNPIYDPIDSTTAAGVSSPDGIFDFLELDSDTDGCNDVTEAGYTDGDTDGLLGTSPVATDPNGLVTSGIDGYTNPNDVNSNLIFDFQEYAEAASIATSPSGQVILVGANASFTVIVNSGDSFSWEESTTGLGGPYTALVDGGVYSGQGTDTLTLTGVPVTYNGYYYRVVVTSSNLVCDLPATSTSALLTVGSDTDGDLIDDLTDLDDDNDGIPDVDEGGDVLDTDGDGVPNRYDLDSDNDGIYDLVESGQLNGTTVVDVGNDGILDGVPADFGTNGLLNLIETAPNSGVLANPTADSTTVNGVATPDGIPDALELNSDGDGCDDVIEAGFTDSDGSGRLGSDTGLMVDPNGLVTTGVGSEGYTTPNDLDNNGIFDFQEFGEAVTIDVAPTDTTVILNANANFDVTLGSGVNPTYEWFESTDGGVSFNSLVPDSGIYMGTDAAVLTINANTLTLDGNQYYVTISAPGYACAGSVSSIPVTLTVYSDFDGDGIGDPIDLDDDNDGITDLVEHNGNDPLADVDGDGVPAYLDDNDNNISLGDANGIVESPYDLDSDGIANHFDLDADGDGVYDTNEAGFADLDLDDNGVIDGLAADFGLNGLFDGVETAPESGTINYTTLNTDGDAQFNFLDIDDDGDSVNTSAENPDPDNNGDPADAQDTDGDGTPDYLDIDDDGDSVYTIFEVANGDTDGDGTSDYLDIDDDGDGVYTIFENPDADADGNPSDAQDTDGDGTPDFLDTDDDGDSILTEFENPDANGDGEPIDAQDSDGDLLPDYLDNDDDNDTILTIFENPDPDGDGDPFDAQNTDGSTGDILPDYLDNDDDGDNVLTELENPDPNGDGNPIDAQDSDGDSIPDYLDDDDDNDGIATIDEDVDGDGDPTNDDTDGDGTPNYLDIDDDNDGITTLTEGSENIGDTDGDGFLNYLDQDADDDGIPDNVEGQSTDGYILPSGVDANGNGLDDAYEPTPREGINPIDTDGDGDSDYLDSDSDNDWVPDSTEGHDYNADGQPDEFPIGDTDGDGLDDAYDGSIGDFLNPNGLINDPATDLPNRDADLESNVFTSAIVVGDTEVDFRDTDDDGDGILTTEEDGDGDGDPTNDNCDSTDASDNDPYPDYLDPTSCDLFPNGFSPNDDGDNDVFIIPALAQFKNFTMDVYDRWGNIVYEYDNNGRIDPIWWDGYSSGTRTINKGQRVPVGTYYFVIKINEGGRQPQTGWVYVNY